MDWFKNLPYEHKFTYAEGLAVRFGSQSLIFSGIGLFGAYLLYIGATLVKRLHNKESRNNSYIKSANGDLSVDLDSSFQNIREQLKEETEQRKTSKSIWTHILNSISILCAWFSFLCFVVTPSVFSGLGVIPVWSSFFITILLFAIMYVILIYWYCPSFLRKVKGRHNPRTHTLWKKLSLTTQLYKVRFGLFLGCGLLYSIAVPLMTADTCFSLFNEGYGSQFLSFKISTRFSRYFTIDTVCPSGQICHLFATLPEDSATAVILNVHTATDVSSITIGYAVQSDPQQPIIKNVTSQSFYVDLEERGARYVHAVVLSSLEPNTNYYFEIYYNNKMQRNGTYLTLPSEKMERNVLLASGGDVGTDEQARAMTAALGDYPIDAILIGGDLAYDNGMRSCYYSHDLFIEMFENLNQKMKRVIPLMFSVGNHDLGFSAFQDTKIDVTQNSYYTFYPQETRTTPDGQVQVPDINERLSYYYHTLGNSVHLTLDSGYMIGYDGVQEEFIKNISEKYINRTKMANYHVPMHPTCFTPIINNPQVRVDSKKYWAPLFEEYKFCSVFENHVHLYKKTFPLVDDIIQPEGQGVVYFGDGNWGISPNECNGAENPYNATGLLEAWSTVNHVWLINITQDVISHFAINSTGQVFDKVYTMSIADYKL